MKYFLSFLLLFWAVGLSAEPLKVTVSIAPLKEFVQSIAGDDAQVEVLVPPGADPHNYEPKPSRLVALKQAELFVALGSGLDVEQVWLPKIESLYPDLPIVRSAKGLASLYGSCPHDHDHHHHHGHYLDPHVWLSPSHAQSMVKRILQSLARLRPQMADRYTAGAQEYLGKLENFKHRAHQQFAGLKHKKFMVYHPSWAYFAKEFGLEQISIQKGAYKPSARYLRKVIKQARKDKIRTIFISPQFSQKASKLIAKEVQAQVQSLDPLAEEYLQNLYLVLSLLSK